MLLFIHSSYILFILSAFMMFIREKALSTVITSKINTSSTRRYVKLKYMCLSVWTIFIIRCPRLLQSLKAAKQELPRVRRRAANAWQEGGTAGGPARADAAPSDGVETREPYRTECWREPRQRRRAGAAASSGQWHVTGRDWGVERDLFSHGLCGPICTD